MFPKSCHLCRVLGQLSKSSGTWQRSLSTSSVVGKTWKYSIKNLQKHLNGKVGGNFSAGIKIGKSKIGNKSEGLSYFQLGSEFKSRNDPVSPKQEQYSGIVWEGLQCLLGSGDVPPEVHEAPLKITRVDVSSSLNGAQVYWTIDKTCSNTEDYTEERIERILQENLSFFRVLLPAYTTITRCPSVSFVHETYEEDKLNALFEKVQKEEEDFMIKNPGFDFEDLENTK